MKLKSHNVCRCLGLPTASHFWKAAIASAKRYARSLFRLHMNISLSLKRRSKYTWFFIYLSTWWILDPPLHLIQKGIHYIYTVMYISSLYSTYSSHRCETFNSLIRAQNIFGNRMAPSRDIARQFSIIEHLRFICSSESFDGSTRYMTSFEPLSLLCII